MTAVPDLGQCMNNNVLGLSFTLSCSPKEISFLDLSLSGNESTGTIEPTTYCKEMSQNSILSARSCRPPHAIRAIPIGNLTHAKRNCLTEKKFFCRTN